MFLRYDVSRLTTTGVGQVRSIHGLRSRGRKPQGAGDLNLGLNVSQGVRCYSRFLIQVVANQGLLHAIKVPNATSGAAIVEANEITEDRRARFTRADSLIDVI